MSVSTVHVGRSQTKQAGAKKGKLADPLAEVRFLHIASTIGAYCLYAQNGSRRKRVSSRLERQALTHLDRLAKVIDKGVRLPGAQDNTRFRHQLDDLVQYP